MALAPYDDITDTISIKGKYTFVMRGKLKHSGEVTAFEGSVWKKFPSVAAAEKGLKTALADKYDNSSRATPTGFGFITDAAGVVIGCIHGSARAVEYSKGGTMTSAKLKLSDKTAFESLDALKGLVQHIINDTTAEAQIAVHEYLVQKTQSIVEAVTPGRLMNKIFGALSNVLDNGDFDKRDGSIDLSLISNKELADSLALKLKLTPAELLPYIKQWKAENKEFVVGIVTPKVWK